MAGVSLSLTAEGALIVLLEDPKGALHRGVVQPDNLTGFAAKVLFFAEMAKRIVQETKPETPTVP